MRELVIVTGASGGIGQSLTKYLVCRGFCVIGVQRSSGIPLEEASMQPDEYVRSVACDLSNSSQLQELASFITSTQVRGLIHLAGARGRSSIMALNSETWLSQYMVRIIAFGVLIRALAESPSEDRFATTIVSESAKTGNGVADYVTANGAMIALMASAAREMSPYRLRVNALLAGLVDTDFHTDAERRAFRALATRITLTGRVTTPDDVSRAILDLSLNSQTTGALWPVTGGSWIG